MRLPGDIDGAISAQRPMGSIRKSSAANRNAADPQLDPSDNDLEIKYLFGRNRLIYERTTDDDNTAAFSRTVSST